MLVSSNFSLGRKVNCTVRRSIIAMHYKPLAANSKIVKFANITDGRDATRVCMEGIHYNEQSWAGAVFFHFFKNRKYLFH